MEKVKMTVKEFAKEAIKNGYIGNNCEGWDWIRANIHELDNIFQLKEYKEQGGMKYKCMPFLVDGQNLTEDEERAIGSAWYLNNQREHRRKKEEYKKKMLNDGWIELREEVVQKAIDLNKKLEVSAIMQGDWLTFNASNKYKPVKHNGNYCLMKLRARTRGFSLRSFEDAFCKLV